MTDSDRDEYWNATFKGLLTELGASKVLCPKNVEDHAWNAAMDKAARFVSTYRDSKGLFQPSTPEPGTQVSEPLPSPEFSRAQIPDDTVPAFEDWCRIWLPETDFTRNEEGRPGPKYVNDHTQELLEAFGAGCVLIPK